LIFFRFVQGVGAAILYTVPVAILPSLFTDDGRGKATGILIGANGFGLAIGPVIGGFIVSALSWRWIFFINLPLILISILLCFKTIPESTHLEHGRKIDWPGLILLVMGFPFLVFATVEGSSWGWLSSTTLMLYVIAITSLTLFYIIELRSESPIIQFKLFKNKMFLIGIVANFSLAFFYTILFFLLPLYLHNLRGQSADQIGLTLLPATLLVALLSPVVGRLIDQKGPKLILLIGFLAFMLSAFLQCFFQADTSMVFILTALILFGLGWGFILSPSIVATLSSVPESIGGVAMGSLGTLHNFGGAIGLAIGTVVYHSFANSKLLTMLAAKKIAIGAWTNSIISNPDTALASLQHMTHLAPAEAQQLFAEFFTYGYRGAMILLLVITMIGFLLVALGLPNRKITGFRKVNVAETL
jgi:EmrB/QacA subfamily drug resistance transporter